MKTIKYLLTLCGVLLFTVGQLSAEEFYKKEPFTAKGYLVMVGGGNTGPVIWQRIIELGGGAEKAKILVVPFAGGAKDDTGSRRVVESIKKYGAKYVDFIFVPREEIDKPENLAKLDSVNVIFFTGGKQHLLYKHLEGTEFLNRIHKIYEDGGVVAGTSAGASIQSRIRITSIELQKSQPGGKEKMVLLEPGYVETVAGFGFLQNIVVDQHFAQRKRYNRLYSAMMSHPDLRGMGIDERTAAIISPDGEMEVMGQNNVMIVEPAAKPTNHAFPTDFIVTILFPGDKYQL
jgi:cyanophycinase